MVEVSPQLEEKNKFASWEEGRETGRTRIYKRMLGKKPDSKYIVPSIP
jgi:hypothetical protein